jgi:hypothetical protein
MFKLNIKTVNLAHKNTYILKFQKAQTKKMLLAKRLFHIS